MSILNNIKLGDIVVFRYVSPNPKSKSARRAKRGFNPPRNILVIAPSYMGHLHGVKIEGLTVTEQEFLQRAFQASYGNVNNIFEPLEAHIQNRKKEIDILNKQRNDLVQQGKRVIVTPNPSDVQFMDRAKKILGSVIGRINTFGKTQVQTTPVQNQPVFQQQMAALDKNIQMRQQELQMWINELQKNKESFNQIEKVPLDPYTFYHSFFLPFIGSNMRMKGIYRKFNLAGIQTPRLVRSVGIIPNVRR